MQNIYGKVNFLLRFLFYAGQNAYFKGLEGNLGGVYHPNPIEHLLWSSNYDKSTHPCLEGALLLGWLKANLPKCYLLHE